MRVKNAFRAVSVSLAVGLLLSGCGSAQKASSTTQITVWSWPPIIKQMVGPFEKANPNIKVKLQNVGTNTKEYTAINNALQAGSGAPDVAGIEYYALPEYALRGALSNLKQFGADKFHADYTTGSWNQVSFNDGVWGMPCDGAPLLYMYNKEVYDKAGVTEAPKTWEEFYQAAKKLKAAGSYILSDGGDGGMYDSLLWQAGAKPYSISKDGKKLSIDLTKDSKAQKVLNYWQRMLDEQLLDTKTKAWSDEWTRSFGDGSVASAIQGSWMMGTIASNPQAKGKWRIAEVPQWNEGDHINSENGGTSYAVLKSSKHQEAAWKFVEFVSHSKQAQHVELISDQNHTPTLNPLLKSEKYIKEGYPALKGVFGDQNIPEEIAKASSHVVRGYQNLPYEVYARSVFPDTAGAAYTGTETLAKGIGQWQDQLVKYGVKQGFSVNGK
ncbi:extracellular solute-binding protein [Bifidobacterium sp. ESL0800]|uniref:ABC transporter substrate-binding protein n=1 Tax=Bifidobacterium sp. ESL0800 TaxID=2983236 RepID=UPI0023F9F628|nr:extracellular solute-binding protein [Bifidobacterium sp. ESL0800]WEV75202.1 extracellular solute-binding protein [Bifidobacterium sp. ESL0800]